MVLVVGCTGGTEAGNPVAQSSGVIGPKGGELSLPDGAKLIIGASALSEDRYLALNRFDKTPPGKFTAYSPVYQLEPFDVTFGSSVTLTVPFEGDPARALFFWAPSGDLNQATQLAGSVNGYMMSASLTTGGAGFVGTLSCFEQGTCGDNACALVQCNTPPAATCTDGLHSKSYVSAGTCDATDGSCTYSSKLTTCSGGCDAQTGVCLPTHETVKNAANCNGSAHQCATGPSGSAIFAECFRTVLSSPVNLTSIKYSLAQGPTQSPTSITLSVYDWDGEGEPGMLRDSESVSASAFGTAGEHRAAVSLAVIPPTFCVGIEMSPTNSAAMIQSTGYTPYGRTYSQCATGGSWNAGLNTSGNGNYCIEADLSIISILVP